MRKMFRFVVEVLFLLYLFFVLVVGNFTLLHFCKCLWWAMESKPDWWYVIIAMGLSLVYMWHIGVAFRIMLREKT